MNIRVAGIIPDSVVDGPGIRYVIFTQGCTHHCGGCHNQKTWDPNGGEEKRIKDIIRDIKKHRFIQGITLSGGDPFFQAEKCAYLASEVKKKYGLNVVTYTGYLFEELIEMNNEGIQNLLKVTDLLIDGPFREDEKDLNIAFRGSKNQRIIDMKKSYVLKRPIIYEINTDIA